MQVNDDDNKIKCRNCLYEVEKGIRRCEYCGILNPTVTNKDIYKIMFAILFIMSIYTYIIK